MDFGLETVQVLIGEDRKPFLLHKDVIRRHSEYFFRAFGPNFQEGDDGSMHLAEVSETTFAIFQKWLYMQTTRSLFLAIGNAQQQLFKEDEQVGADSPNAGLSNGGYQNGVYQNGVYQNGVYQNGGFPNAGYPFPYAGFQSYAGLQSYGPMPSFLGVHRGDESIQDTSEVEAHDEPKSGQSPDQGERRRGSLFDGALGHLFELYIFADAYETIALRNDILNAIRTLTVRTGFWPGFKVVPRAFKLLPTSSTFCQYLIKVTALEWDGEWEGENMDEDKVAISSLPLDFLFPVAKITSQRASIGKKRTDELKEELAAYCSFHEHVGEDKRQACTKREKQEIPLIHGLVAMCLAAADKRLSDKADIST